MIVDPLAVYSLDHAGAPVQKDHDDHALVKVRILEQGVIFDSGFQIFLTMDFVSLTHTCACKNEPGV